MIDPQRIESAAVPLIVGGAVGMALGRAVFGSTLAGVALGVVLFGLLWWFRNRLVEAV
ncbi:hypothetical protein [Halohasta salina]|uniref:hypothetical protein n=1 Tax=Halohasta salina TaxID=2961621 RepID=UPI0020A4D322|nr:hypothetical protein [Halohasta salina]